MNLIAKDIANAFIFAVTGWMLKTYLIHWDKMKGLSMTERGLASSDQRLASVEQTVESIAIEIERIGEGQRYVTKLLNEYPRPLPVGLAVPALPIYAALT